MAAVIGRLQRCRVFEPSPSPQTADPDQAARGWKFACLSHNTYRGAAGGALLVAELLAARGELQPS